MTYLKVYSINEFINLSFCSLHMQRFDVIFTIINIAMLIQFEFIGFCNENAKIRRLNIRHREKITLFDRIRQMALYKHGKLPIPKQLCAFQHYLNRGISTEQRQLGIRKYICKRLCEGNKKKFRKRTTTTKNARWLCSSENKVSPVPLHWVFYFLRFHL